MTLLQSAHEHYREGRIETAEAQIRLVLERDPHDVEANVLAGAIFAKTGRLTQAAELFQAALKLEPGHHDALVTLGMVLHSQGNHAGAAQLLRRAVEQVPDDSVALNLLGICLLKLGDASSAIEAFQRVLALQPSRAEVYANLGMALRLLNEGEQALSAFNRAVQLAPGHPQNYVQLSKQYERLGRRDEALKCLEDGLSRHPHSAHIMEALAVAYAKRRRHREAEPLFEKVAPLGPYHAYAFATWLQEEGRFDDSVGVLTRSLSAHPLQGVAYLGLAEARCFEWDGTTLVNRASALLDNPKLDSRSQMYLSYALGRSFDHQERYEQAMGFFDRANDLAYHSFPASMSFDRAATELEPAILSEIYTKELFERLRDHGDPSNVPIFIVGMIRSGTTLLDRILSSHPDVESAGEQLFWTVEGDPIHRRWRREEPRPIDVETVAKGYAELLKAEAGPARHVTDKMPVNYRHLGLIHAALPNSKILHIRRDPLDTCLSIYTTFLHGDSNFAYRKENIVAFYRSYLRVMEHWRTVLPTDRFLELDYEDLVTQPEATIRQVLDFCDLGWDDACLSPDAGNGSILTPSRWQVRQPIYTTSIGRWRKYEPWLGALGDLIDTTSQGRTEVSSCKRFHKPS